jgi:outer membrane protein OmpA-like peptidoglycan-associated protein
MSINYTMINIFNKSFVPLETINQVGIGAGFFLIQSYSNSFLGSSRLDFSGNYQINTKKLADVGATLSQLFFRSFNLYLVSKYNVPSKNLSLSLNLRLEFPFTRSTTNINSSEGNMLYSEDLEGVLGLNTSSWEFTFANPSYINNYANSAVDIRLFIDVDGNDKYDGDEPIIPNINLNIKDVAIDSRSTRGNIQAFNLTPYTRYNVTIDKKSIKNPNLIPKYTEFSFITDPNVIKAVDIPCYITGIVEGTVSRLTVNGKREQSGVKVHFMRKDSSIHEVQPVFSDGSFYKMGLMPGDYIAWVDSLQCAILNVEQDIPVREFTVRSTKTGDFVSDLNFELKDKPSTLALDPRKKDGASKLTPSQPKGYDGRDSVGGHLVPLADTNQALTVADTSGTGANKDLLGTVIAPSADTTAPKLTPEAPKPPAPLKMSQTFAYSGPRVTYLTPPMQRELDKIAAFMLANTGSKLFIEGHTDVFGTLDEHTKVSEQRANEVLSYMVRKGIAKSRLFASGKGSLQPLADNATEAGRKKNRRVELRVITQ